MKANKDIRELAEASGVFLWRVANALGMNDSNFSKKLRHELPDEEKAKIRQIISELSTRAV